MQPRAIPPEELESHNMEVLFHQCDLSGEYLGLLPPPTNGQSQVVPEPPAPTGYVWSIENGWTVKQTLAEVKEQKKAEIDAAAGNCRLRFITDVPGQQATYIRKAQDAKAYIDSGYTVVPAYIAAEAAATGNTPQVCAATILQLAALWEEQIGPLIEQTRIGAKRAVENAQTVAECESITSSALQAFDQIGQQ